MTAEETELMRDVLFIIMYVNISKKISDFSRSWNPMGFLNYVNYDMNRDLRRRIQGGENGDGAMDQLQRFIDK